MSTINNQANITGIKQINNNGKVAIVGGGLAGSLLALMLAQEGHEVDLYERRSDPRNQSDNAGRSINLGLSKRGMNALKLVGLLDQVLSSAVVMKGRVIHTPDGETSYQAYGKNTDEVLHSIDRNELNHLLLDSVDKLPGVNLYFDHKLVSINKASREIVLNTQEEQVRVNPLWVVGADGAFSTMRKELQKGERADFHQEFLEWGYKELTLPADSNGNSVIELDALHVWPRNHCLFVSHPNLNGSHTLTLFLPFEGKDSFDSIKCLDELETLFVKYFPDLIPMLPSLKLEWEKHPVGSLLTTRTSKWNYDDWGVLVGDACHAQLPFYGQGMNSAFEDCCLLMSALKTHKENKGKAFHAFESSRRIHTNALGQLSKDNFVELRQKVRSPWFMARKKLDLAISKLWPTAWQPLYSMIAHSTMPYGEAMVKARRQDRILNVIGTCTLLGVTLVAGFLFKGSI